MEPSAALILTFTDATTASERDRLVALLADAGLVAILEDDVVSPSTWTAHFADRTARDAASSVLRHSPEFTDLRVESLDVEDEGWARRTQAELPAIRIGRIVVAPPWDVPDGVPLQPDATVVIIEPSRGFGTGHHQSTRLCLTLLQSRDLTGRTMIDVGTGSGVLAIAAARLGAAYVSAIDVDPDAIENARENAARNGVAGIVEAHVDDLTRTTLSAADVVTANLTGSLLERHAGDLVRLVKPSGVLITAGFTVDEGDRVTAAFAERMSLLESAEEDGWLGFVMSREGACGQHGRGACGQHDDTTTRRHDDTTTRRHDDTTSKRVGARFARGAMTRSVDTNGSDTPCRLYPRFASSPSRP